MSQKQTEFSLEAPPGGDIWKKPPSHDVWTAPTTLDQSKPLPLNTFKSARITFKSNWTIKFDQAGIVILITEPGKDRSWIKAGLELYDGQPKISFVGCDRWADWSVGPVHGDSKGEITVELRREGQALWAYELILDDKGQVVQRYPFRECTWIWDNEDKKQIQVGAMCARPTKEGATGPLKVEFKELVVET